MSKRNGNHLNKKKMKHQKLLSICAILFGFVGSTPVQAQVIDESTDKVVWFGTSLADAVAYCNNGGYVYLYNVDQDKFLNAGSSFGVQGVLSTVGMRLQIVPPTLDTDHDGYYRVRSRIHNNDEGDHMSIFQYTNGSQVYLDRAGRDINNGDWTNPPGTSRPFWRFPATTATPGSVTVNGDNYDTYTYTIQNRQNGVYLGLNGNNVVVRTAAGNATRWRLVTEKDYEEAMNKVIWGEVDLGAFVQDAEFGRDNKDARYWVWSSDVPDLVHEGTDYDGATITLDEWDVTSSPKHWHQRNQNFMLNGYAFPTTTSTIPRNQVGNNVANATEIPNNNDITCQNIRTYCGQYYAAEIYNEQIRLAQTAQVTSGTLLKPGLYKMTCQAFYYDDIQGQTNNDVAYFFVTRTQAGGGESVTESLPIIPMNKEEIGSTIHPHSGVSAGYVFDNNAKAYLHEFYFEVEEGMQITFGMETLKAQGWAVIGNIHLYAHGKQAIFLDEDWGTEETIVFRHYEKEDGTFVEAPETGNPYEVIHYNDKYEYPVTLYYQRTMTTNKWNTICLPINLTGAQVRQAFGNDCDLAEIDELEVVTSDNETGGHYTIHFKQVDLDTEGLVMGKPYIIKPTHEPQIVATAQKPYEVEFGNGEANQVVPIDGPTYTILGVTKKTLTEYDVNNLNALLQPGEGNTYSAYSKPITFTGTFYRQEFTPAAVKNGNEHFWFITKGNMYHLKGERTDNFTLWATYAYLHAPKSGLDANVSNLSISLDGVTAELSAIDELPLMIQGDIDDAAIYNLAGQRIEGASLRSLPRGIYIVNGRKYTVR